MPQKCPKMIASRGLVFIDTKQTRSIILEGWKEVWLADRKEGCLVGRASARLGHRLACANNLIGPF